LSSTNFQLWNPAQNNMLNDTDYSNDTMRLNGAVAEIYPSDLHNKMMFQVTTFLKAFSDSLVNQGYTLNDSNYINLVNTYSTLVNTQGSKMSGAFEFANPSSVTSVSGILSLTNTSNTFIVNGSETITTITGGQLSQGWYLITWNTVRTLINSGTLNLLGGINRTTSIGDTGIYQIVSNGAATPVFTVTELFYQPFTPLIGLPLQGTFKKLKISVSSNTSASITADQAILWNATNQPITITGINLTLNTGVIGVNGIDTGTLAASTWYNLFVIYNPTTTTTSCLMSLSDISPTLPSGYTYFARAGSVREDSSEHLMRTLQMGNKVQYIVTPGTNTAAIPSMASGISGNINTPTWSAVNTTPFVPPLATVIRIILNSPIGGTAMLAPNNNYGAYNAANTFLVNSNSVGAFANSYADMLLESTNIYYASDGSAAYILCSGWEENI
jgi:hypothetical protein